MKTGAVAAVGVVVGAVAALALIAVVGGVVLVIRLSQPSPRDYARSHVQSLFVSSADRRTATVSRCSRLQRADFEGNELWACAVSEARCTRTYRFVVNHEYGTEPYDNRSFAATNDPCAPGL